MKIVIPGGSGQVGTVLARHFHGQGHAVVVLSREPRKAPWQTEFWDGRTPGKWIARLDGSDVCINLAGHTVNCRYNARNRRRIYDSRVASTTLLNQVIGSLQSPPALWINASTATIYRHSFDREMDEATGELGGHEAGTPDTWNFSIDVAKAWEQAFLSTTTPKTRKIAIRSAMTFSPDRGGVFDVFSRLVRLGLGGKQGTGAQFVSWIHEDDFASAIDFLIRYEHLSGTINVAAPNPLTNRDFMSSLRRAWGVPVGLPAWNWALEIGAFFLRTESELILKSRRVVSTRLEEAGFTFHFPEWSRAAADLVRRWRTLHRPPLQRG